MAEETDKPNTSPALMKQGAEARIFSGEFGGRPTVIKERFSKSYRHPALDASLTARRTKSEARTMLRCRMHGISTPAVYHVDLVSNKIYMEHLVDSTIVKDFIKRVQSQPDIDQMQQLKPLGQKIGTTIATMHKNNIIHGDLTTSNMLLRHPEESMDLVMIDFGLGYIESVTEDKGVDLYVLERALLSTHPKSEDLFSVIMDSYIATYGHGAAEVLAKYEEVRLRGRKRTMVG